MERETLDKMKLEALRTLALEKGIEGASQLGRAQLIEQLAAPAEAAKPEAVPEPVAPAEDKTPRLQRKPGVPARGSFDVPSSTVHPHAEELETLTMARLYVAEGQYERAIEIYEKLVQADPEDVEIGGELEAVRRKGEKKTLTGTPAPATTSTSTSTGEPFGMLDLEEPPETYGVDECEVLYKDPHWVFVYWEVTDGGLSGARAQLGPSAGQSRLVLRLFSTVAGASGMDRQIHDVDLDWNHGRKYLQAPRQGAHLRAAVGLLSIEGYFAPIAHSSLTRLPPVEPGDGPVEWMEVLPDRSRGRERQSLVIVRRGHPHAERGLLGAIIGTPGGSSSGERK
jgi:hypothetical protein